MPRPLRSLRPTLGATAIAALLAAMQAAAGTHAHEPERAASVASAHAAGNVLAMNRAAGPRGAKPRRGPDTPPYGLREDVQAYMQALSDSDPTLDRAWLEQTLGQARHLPQVTRLIMPARAGVTKDWSAYRDRFIEPRRIDAGVAFWDQHAPALQAAERRWGVPAALVVGIIGVETFYGRITGGFRVLDALASLAFDFPTGRSDRSAFFRDELTALLQLARRQSLDLRSLQGSYAGAIGWGQFMPSSWAKYGVDFDGDGAADLHSNPVDSIGSVAHFLAAHGWQAGLPTHWRVQVPEADGALAQLLAPDIRPTFSAAQMTALGARLEPAATAHPGQLALVELQNGGAAPTYVAGSENFWVVTRYNWSAYYAMAVIELGQAIAYERTTRQAAARAAAPASAENGAGVPAPAGSAPR